MDFSVYPGGQIYVPTNSLSESRQPSESFVEQLNAFDSRLYVTWNRHKHRWVIEECMQHAIEAPTGGHIHLCRRSYVWMVQGDNGEYRPLDSGVIDSLRSMDVSRKYGNVENMIRAMDEIDRKKEEKERKDIKDGIQERKKDNKRQLEQAIMLIDRHDFFGDVNQ